jgi:hypothetical protein
MLHSSAATCLLAANICLHAGRVQQLLPVLPFTDALVAGDPLLVYACAPAECMMVSSATAHCLVPAHTHSCFASLATQIVANTRLSHFPAAHLRCKVHDGVYLLREQHKAEQVHGLDIALDELQQQQQQQRRQQNVAAAKKEKGQASEGKAM